MQDIKADNNQAISVLNIQTGAIQVSLLNNAFHFPKAKMEEDFNEDYIESAKYPKSTFKGMITDISKIDVGKKRKLFRKGKWRLNDSWRHKKYNSAGNNHYKERQYFGHCFFQCFGKGL